MSEGVCSTALSRGWGFGWAEGGACLSLLLSPTFSHPGLCSDSRNEGLGSQSPAGPQPSLRCRVTSPRLSCDSGSRLRPKLSSRLTLVPGFILSPDDSPRLSPDPGSRLSPSLVLKLSPDLCPRLFFDPGSRLSLYCKSSSKPGPQLNLDSGQKFSHDPALNQS